MQKPKQSHQTSLTSFIRHKLTQSKQPINPSLQKSANHSQASDNKSSPQPPVLINVQFYRNQRVSQPNGDYIDRIHRLWHDNFHQLERHHGFIQWLFPNSFSSRFNAKSSALTPQEEKVFRSDLQISKRYVTSYQMMLRFYGMKLKSKQTGEVVRSRDVHYLQRYVATLLTSFHNHMRITRILCSLTMIGFGRYAKQLSIFLHQQIHGPNVIFFHYIKGDLKPLAKYNVDKDWKEYKDYVETYDDLNVYLKRFQDEKKYEKEQDERLVGLVGRKEEEEKGKGEKGEEGRIVERKKENKIEKKVEEKVKSKEKINRPQK